MSPRHERRRAPRCQTLEEHGIVSARVRPGHEVVLLDVSAGGALVECACRLLPGSMVDMHLVSPGRCASVRGRVLRCTVVRLRASGVWYRGAVGFDRDLPWFLTHEISGYEVPTQEARQSLHRRGDATQDPL